MDEPVVEREDRSIGGMASLTQTTHGLYFSAKQMRRLGPKGISIGIQSYGLL